MSATNLGPVKAWELNAFSAHKENVSCLALGHKSGRVLVTGGHDKMIKLWVVGNTRCVLSLKGHNSKVECVRFGNMEEIVCAGFQNGEVTVWDIAAQRRIIDFTGDDKKNHYNVTCLDVSPCEKLFATGSASTRIKWWDIRQKKCICQYNGHSKSVSALRYSPDGKYIASGSDDGSVKIWDLRVCRSKLGEFKEDAFGYVRDIEFHPHKPLLASAFINKTVSFYDLTTWPFQHGFTSEKDTKPVDCLTFDPESDRLFSSSRDAFNVYDWKPYRLCDKIEMSWGMIKDMTVIPLTGQLIGASFKNSTVSCYVVDLHKVEPLIKKISEEHILDPDASVTDFRSFIVHDIDSYEQIIRPLTPFAVPVISTAAKTEEAMLAANPTSSADERSVITESKQVGTNGEETASGYVQESSECILKEFDSMREALAIRKMNVEIIHELWKKDPKVAIEKAVSLNDPSCLVDLLSVITLHPSALNVDVCILLLPPIKALLESKDKINVVTGCGAIELIAKNSKASKNNPGKKHKRLVAKLQEIVLVVEVVKEQEESMKRKLEELLNFYF